MRLKTYFSARHADCSGHACRKFAQTNLRMGAEEYFGRICDKCQTNLRHTKDRSCVLCSELKAIYKPRGSVDLQRCRAIANNAGNWPTETMHSDRLIRAAAKLAGMHAYTGVPCDQCGLRGRYTLRGQCISCVGARNATRKKKTAPTKKVEAVNFDWLFE